MAPLGPPDFPKALIAAARTLTNIFELRKLTSNSFQSSDYIADESPIMVKMAGQDKITVVALFSIWLESAHTLIKISL